MPGLVAAGRAPFDYIVWLIGAFLLDIIPIGLTFLKRAGFQRRQEHTLRENRWAAGETDLNF